MDKEKNSIQFKMVLPGSTDWFTAVALVREKYHQVFDARINPEPDCFFACIHQDVNDQPIMTACVGITSGESRTLFSEQYLNDCAEMLIGRHESLALARQTLVEAGSFAAVCAQAAVTLLHALPLLIWCTGGRYVLCTATQSLHILLKSVGIEFVPLQDADPRCLGEPVIRHWGRYYEQMPVTGYISVERAIEGFHAGNRYSFESIVVNLNRHRVVRERNHAMV